MIKKKHKKALRVESKCHRKMVQELNIDNIVSGKVSQPLKIAKAQTSIRRHNKVRKIREQLER